MTARNVVLVCLDTVRKDYFDAHAPRLRERADLDFAACRAASSWSVPSHASMFTGTLPHEHGLHAHARDFSVLDRADTFLADLPDHRAIGVSANVWAGSAFGFDGLFDDFADVSPDRRFPDGVDVAEFGQSCDATGLGRQAAFLRTALAHDHPLASLANGAVVQVDNWLARLPVPNPIDDGASVIARTARSQVAAAEEPFVLFANFMDAHGPLSHVRGYDRSLHDAPLGWTSEAVDWEEVLAREGRTAVDRYTGLYGAAIDYLDRRVCALVDRIQATTDRETTVVVTADHGDHLGEDGRWGHVESTVSEPLVHVPLVVLNAPEGWRGVDESAYVSHLRLGELLVGLARGEVPDVTAGEVAVERVGHSGQLATVAEKRGTAADRAVRAVYRGDRKYEWDAAGGRRVLRVDPAEPCRAEPVGADFEPGEFEAHFAAEPDLAAYKQRASEEAAEHAVGGAARDRLEELGYV